MRVPEPTGGRDRTDTFLRILDFESSASANSATPASLISRHLRSFLRLRFGFVPLLVPLRPDARRCNAPKGAIARLGTQSETKREAHLTVYSGKGFAQQESARNLARPGEGSGTCRCGYPGKRRSAACHLPMGSRSIWMARCAQSPLKLAVLPFTHARRCAI